MQKWAKTIATSYMFHLFDSILTPFWISTPPKNYDQRCRGPIHTRSEVSEALDGSVHCHGSQHSSHQLGGISTIGRRRSCTATWDNLLLNLSHLEGCWWDSQKPSENEDLLNNRAEFDKKKELKDHFSQNGYCELFVWWRGTTVY